MLITLSQLPALSMLLKDSMATPPGHVSLFAIRQMEDDDDDDDGGKLPSGAAAANQETCQKVKRGGNVRWICGILRLERSHTHPTEVNSSENQLGNILTMAAANVAGLH